MSVENKWRNTKFLLTQLIPGKEACYQPVSMSKSHVECFKILGIGSGDMVERAIEADKVLGLDVPMPSRQERKQMRKQMKRALDGTSDHGDISIVQCEKKQKQTITESDSGEVEYGPLRQVAMA